MSMAKRKVYTDHVFDTEKEAWDCVIDNYSVETNYIMRAAKKAGKKVTVGVEKKGRGRSSAIKYNVVIYID